MEDFDDDETSLMTELPADRRGALTPAPMSHVQLLTLTGPTAGAVHDLGARTVLGRGPACDFSTSTSSVSRTHAEIVRSGPQHLVLTDLGSSNGTFVNGVPVRSHRLAIGDRVQLGQGEVFVVIRPDPLRERLWEQQKMEAIGRLSAGVAHDFNNLGVAALTTLDHLRDSLEQLGDHPNVNECMRDLTATLTRSAELTRALATLGRKRRSITATRADVASVCKEIARLCERTFGPNISVVTEVEVGLFARAYAAELHQILLNLCLNARDAMPDGGTLFMSAAEEKGRAVVSVSDTGSGMTTEVRKRVFEPYFTTKSEGRGSGLGLATVYDLVLSLEGDITVASDVDRGTKFRVALPLSMDLSLEAPGSEPGRPPPVSSSSRTLKVLLIDDQPLVRRGIGRLLTSRGHDVRAAGDGNEALTLAARRLPDLVILDLDLPGMSGEETLAHLQTIAPHARVLIVSGQVDMTRRDRVLRLGGHAYLPKPFDGKALAAAVDEAIGRPPSERP